MVLAAVPRIYGRCPKAVLKSLTPVTIGETATPISYSKTREERSSKFFLPAFFTVQAASITHMEDISGFPLSAIPLHLPLRRNRFLASLEMTVQGKCQTKCTSHQPLAAVHFCSNFSKISVTRSTYGTPSFSNIGIASLPSRPVRMPMHFAPARRLPMTSE